MTRRARLTLLPAFVAFALTLTLMVAVASADTGGPPPLTTESGLAAWWSSGALAAPLAALVFGLLVVVEKLGATRWRWAAWLRTGSMRGWISLAVGNLGVMLPAIASGSVTWGGLSVALLGGLLAVRPGGGEPRPDPQTGDAPT